MKNVICCITENPYDPNGKLRTTQLSHCLNGKRETVNVYKVLRGSAQCNLTAEPGAWDLEFNT